MLRMRLARRGRKGNPVFSLIVADKKSPRDGKFKEKLGTYSPCVHNETRFIFKKDRVEYWLSQGAQASERVHHLLSLEGITEKKVYPAK